MRALHHFRFYFCLVLAGISFYASTQWFWDLLDTTLTPTKIQDIKYLILLTAVVSVIWVVVQIEHATSSTEALEKITKLEEANASILASDAANYREIKTEIARGIVDKDQRLHELAQENRELHRRNSDLDQRLRDAVLGSRVCIDVNVSNFNNFLTYIPLYVADRMGFFKEENIDVKFEHGASDLAAIKALGNGQSHIAITDPVYAFHPDVHSLDPVLLSPFLHKVALWGVSRKPIDELRAALREHEPTILTYPVDTTAYKLAKLFADDKFTLGGRARYSIKPYALTNGASSDHETYLTNLLFDDQSVRQSDIIILSEPEITWIVKKWQTHPYHFDLQRELYKNREFCFTAIISKRSWVETHPEVVKRFLKAIRVAFTFVYALPTLDFDILKDYKDVAQHDRMEDAIKSNHLWSQTISGVRTLTYETYPNNLVMTDVDIAHVIETLRRMDYFPRSLAFDDKERGALYDAYGISYPLGGAEIPSRIYDIHKHLQMAAE